MNIVLSSQSPNRRQLLNQAGLPFEAFAPCIDEKIENPQDSPSKICLKIAQKKALKAQQKFPQSLIIASDQLAFANQKFYGKALKPEVAIQNLKELQGQTHDLITSLYMCHKEKVFTHVSINKMTMRPLTEQQIKHYVLTDQPLNAAGSYHIEAQGIGLFTKIETDDFYSIRGLPMITLINQLIKWGYPYLTSK